MSHLEHLDAFRHIRLSASNSLESHDCIYYSIELRMGFYPVIVVQQ
jgi:hypothetical protein